MPVANNNNNVSNIQGADAVSANCENENLETAITLFCIDQEEKCETEMKEKSKELQERQLKVKYLNDLLQIINNSLDEEGSLDLESKDDLQDMLKEAKEIGVDISDKTYFTEQEKDRLIENIRITCDGFNVENNMQIQDIQKLTTHRYEIFQLAKSIIKTLHEAKLNYARGMAK